MGSTHHKKAKEQKLYNEDKLFNYKQMVKNPQIANPNDYYKFLQKIGEGCYSQVYKVQCLSTGQFRVIKKVRKDNGPKCYRSLFNEFDILREMDHPNVIKVFEMFEYESHSYLVTQYLPGKDVLDLLASLKHLDEEKAYGIFYQCLLALNYLHLNKVMHRDIKLQNIIYDENTASFKLIDFGSALRYNTSSPKERRCTGTIHYMAPEVINKYYNMKCDVWSLGVLLYVLLSGSAPFMGDTNQKIIQKTLKQPVSFDKPVWQTRSKDVKSLLSKMLDKNFERRPSIPELLKDSWVMSFKKASKKVQKTIAEQTSIYMENLLRFRKVKLSDIQLGILLFMTHFVIKIEEQSVIRSFLTINQSANGQISEKQIKDALRQYCKVDCFTADQAAHELVAKIDLNGSNDISYSEFLLGATDLKKVLTKENISKAFRYIDTDQSGKLSMNELQAKLGDHLDESQYKRLACLFDANSDGEIDLQEFTIMLENLLHHY